MTILPNSPEFVGAVNGTWQQHMKWAIRNAADLAQRLDLPLQSVCPVQSSGQFPLFVPLPYLERIEPGNPNDPLLRQVLPSFEENAVDSGSADPVSESDFVLTPGLLQKYQGRALLVVNGTCAIHCRYCFRRHYPYNDVAAGQESWREPLATIVRDESISEVILSGGDPLTLVDDSLEALFGEIEAIDHVSRIRIHTRLPIVIPQRVTQRLLQLISKSRLDVVVVIHCNHANEIDLSVATKLQELKPIVSALLNQSVLLRGVNDDVKSLTALSQRLIETGTLPYYLHQLDPVQGAMHFEASIEKGLQLIESMRAQLPGYLVPRYVREVPGETAKTILA